MKIYSQNLHSYIESNIFSKLESIAEFIYTEKIDVVCLQEVAQYNLSEELYDNVKVSNTAIILKNILKAKYNLEFNMHLEMFKLAFGIYDEGSAILSRYPIIESKVENISKTGSYDNWEKRCLQYVVIEKDNQEICICNTHVGWTTKSEVFQDQIEMLLNNIDFEGKSNLIIAGDFNVSDTSKEYQYLISKGLKDLCVNINNQKMYTFPEDKERIDYIFSNYQHNTKDKLVFVDNMVSDHFGILLEVEKWNHNVK